MSINFIFKNDIVKCSMPLSKTIKRYFTRMNKIEMTSGMVLS